MKRNILLIAIIVIFSAGFWYVKQEVFSKKPDVLLDLEAEQTQYNEKLITTQILSESMDRVYAIFSNNLANEKNDKKFEAASMEFLDNLTDILARLEIKTLKIKPVDVRDKIKYIEIPYELKIECTFKKFGKFIAELEKNDRLINIFEFELNNTVERLATIRDAEQLASQIIEMEISTITLKKMSS